MKAKRHAKILDLIKENNINTQEELLGYLRAEGFDVTQATVSRDIKELRLVKNLSSDGKYVYTTGNEAVIDFSSKFYNMFAGSVISVESAVNLVVIKCYVGMAQAVCASMDALHWESVVGTIAGDDTILVVVRSEDAALRLASDLKGIIGGR